MHLILVLANTLVLSAGAAVVPLAAIDHVGDPSTNAVTILGFGGRSAVLQIRWFDVETRDGIFRGEPGASALRTTTTAAAAHQGFDFCPLLWCGCLCCGVSKQRVHILEADVGGLGVDEVDCTTLVFN